MDMLSVELSLSVSAELSVKEREHYRFTYKRRQLSFVYSMEKRKKKNSVSQATQMSFKPQLLHRPGQKVLKCSEKKKHTG